VININMEYVIMLELQKFLSEHSLEELSERYAIKVKRHPHFRNLVHFSYNQIESPLYEPLVQECRGLILDQDDNWKVVAFPYKKFFNHGEPYAAKIDWNTARVYEKLDGTLITLYHYDGDWHIATTGTPDADAPVSDFGFTFQDLFWKVWDELDYVLPEAWSDYTFMFELMTPYNRVVVNYNNNRIVLHGLRNNQTLQEERPERAASSLGFKCVRSFDLKSLEEVINAARELDFLKQEGFVVADAYFNRLKIKNPQYVVYHHLKSSFSIKKAVDIIRNGETAEFVSYFPELANILHQLKEHYDQLIGKVYRLYNIYKNIDSDKQFAEYALQHDVAHILFALRRGKANSPEEYLKNIHLDAVMRLLRVDELEEELINQKVEVDH